MHSQRNEQNTLATFKNVTLDDILDYLEMTERDSKILFTGAYQLAQAVSYLVEMVDTEGKLRIEYVKDESNVLKLKVPSRHISRTAYRCFSRYKPNTYGISGLTHYTCCCSHIATVVYYLSYSSIG